MVNYNRDNSSQFFQDQLEIKLLELGALWGKSPKSAAAITEVRAAAKQRILNPTDARLKRVKDGASFDKYKRFFETQLVKEYHPLLFIQGVQPRSAMQKQAVEFLQAFARDVSKAVMAAQTQKSKTRDVNKTPSWAYSGLTPTEHVIAGMDVREIDVSQEDFAQINWNDRDVPDDLFQDEQTKFDNQAHFMRQEIVQKSPSDMKSYLKETLRPLFAKNFSELADRRKKYSGNDTFQLGERALISFQESVKTMIKEAVAKVTPKSDISQKTYDSMIVKIQELKAKIELGVAHATFKKLEEFQEKRMSPKLHSLQKEIAALETSNDQPRLLDIKEKHLQMLQGQSQNITKQLKNVPVLTETVEPTMTRFAKAVLFGQSKRDPAAAKFIDGLKNSPALEAEKVRFVEEVPTKPTALSARDVSDAKIVKWKDVPISQDEPILSEQRAVVAVAKPKISILKSLMATAAVTAALVGSVMAGLAGGTLYREAQRDTAQDNARLVSAQADFNESAAIYNSRPLTEIFAAPAAQSAKVKTAEKNIHKTVKFDDSPKFAADLPHKHRVDYKVAKDPDAQPAKAKVDFRPAAAANDTKVTYHSGVVQEPFDITTSRVSVDTWSKACDYLKAKGNTVEGGVCPR